MEAEFYKKIVEMFNEINEQYMYEIAFEYSTLPFSFRIIRVNNANGYTTVYTNYRRLKVIVEIIDNKKYSINHIGGESSNLDIFQDFTKDGQIDYQRLEFFDSN